MAYGISLTNSSGVEMLVGTERCFVLSQKVDVSTNVGTSTGGTGSYTISYRGSEAPMVFIGPRSGTTVIGMVAGVFKSGSRWVVKYTGTNPRLYIFIPHPTSANTSWGINIYTSSGALAYHSGYTILRMVGTAVLGTPPTTGDGAKVSISSTGLPAILSTRGRMTFVDSGGNPGGRSYANTYSVSYSSGKVWWDYVGLGISPVPPQTYQYCGAFPTAMINGNDY